MDIKELSLLEASLLKDKLHKLCDDYPQLNVFKSLYEEAKERVESDASYQKGKQLLLLAEENGLDDGYAQPSDYFFSVYKGKLKNKKNETYSKLLLCLKFRWWMNGETYVERNDNSQPRNFWQFVPKSVDIDFDYDYIVGDKDAEKVRKWMLKAGLEEKPELSTIYENYLNADEVRREQYLKELRRDF